MIAELACHDKINIADEKVRDIIDSWLKTANPGYKTGRFWGRVEKNK